MEHVVDAKNADIEKVISFLKGKRGVRVSDIMENSGASRLRVFPILFELQLDNKLMVEDEENLGCPKTVTLVETACPKVVFSSDFFDWMMEQAVRNPRKRWNYNLHNSLQSPAQRLLYALDPATQFPIHRHRDTAETYVLLRGNVDIIFYGEDGEVQKRLNISSNGLLGGQVLQDQYHTIVVNEPSIIMLVKDGPYEPTQEQDVLNIDM